MSSKPKTKHRSKHKEPKIETRNLAPVQDAVREYRVIEDGAYAYHLQEAEIENHYAQNVNERRMVQEDIRKAKELQDEEDKKARILTLDEEQERKQMDEELAEFIQEEIFKRSVQEEQERKEREERDTMNQWLSNQTSEEYSAQLARSYQELALLMEETERRHSERVKQYEENDLQLAAQMQNMKITPPGSRDEQRMRLMTDEELAKRLQEEEKLKGERTKIRKEELKSVVEMQDEELAKYIHGKEIEAAEWKFRKEKEKARKSKKKGKWNNEPLYYDDNISPPDFHELHGTPRHEDPQRIPQNGYHDSPPEYTPREDDRRRQQEREKHKHQKDERRPDRPPPPRFSQSHNTEVKVPLDDSQRRSSERHSSRTSPGQEYSRDLERSSSHHHHQQRSYSEKDRNSRGSNDRLDHMREHRRPSSEKHSERRENHHQDPWKPREHEPHPKDKPRDRRLPEQRSHHDSRNSRHEPKHPARQENGRPIPKPRESASDLRLPPDPGMKKKKK